MMTILAIIGLLVLLAVIYCLATNTPMPKWLTYLLLGTAVLVLLFCLMQEAGCAPPFLVARPH